MKKVCFVFLSVREAHFAGLNARPAQLAISSDLTSILYIAAAFLANNTTSSAYANALKCWSYILTPPPTVSIPSRIQLIVRLNNNIESGQPCRTPLVISIGFELSDSKT